MCSSLKYIVLCGRWVYSLTVCYLLFTHTFRGWSSFVIFIRCAAPSFPVDQHSFRGWSFLSDRLLFTFAADRLPFTFPADRLSFQIVCRLLLPLIVCRSWPFTFAADRWSFLLVCHSFCCWSFAAHLTSPILLQGTLQASWEMLGLQSRTLCMLQIPYLWWYSDILIVFCLQ